MRMIPASPVNVKRSPGLIVTGVAMRFERFNVVPIGLVRKEDRRTWLEIHEEFRDALDGLKEGDWVKLILWFDGSDTPEKRSILKVHPYNNPQNPLTGVFATRSPVRPNPLALYTVRIESMEGGKLYIDWIDARDGTPIADMKIFVERLDCPSRFSNVPVGEEDLDIGRSVQIGDVNVIPEGSGEHLVIEVGEGIHRSNCQTGKETNGRP